MEIGIGVKVDPGDSVNKTKAVEDGLRRTEERGKAAAQAMLGLSGAFKSLAQAMQQQRDAAERAGQAHDRLDRANRPLAQGFAKIAEAMQREQQMLERIHGPARRYAEDLQALDSLLARNVISTQQYADQVRRLNSAIDSTPKNTNVPVSGPSSGGALSAVRAGAAAVGIGVSASQIGGMANEFQNLENRLRYLAGGDMAKVNSLFGELQGVAQRTRGDLSATTEGFVRISLATKQMGLSTRDTMALTERLNKAITLSGATSAEAAAGMIQLSQGLASGALRGDELRSVMESLPAVADVIASGLGVTRGQLRELGAQGRITADVIVDSFKKAGSTLDKDFGNTVPTLAQSWTMFKNEMMVTVGELNKSLGITDALGSAMSALGTAVNVATAPLKLLGAAFDALGVSGGGVTKVLGATALGMLALGGPAGVILGTVAALSEYTTTFDEMYTLTGEYYKKLQDLEDAQRKLNTAFAIGGESFKKALPDMIAHNLQLALGAEVAEAFRSKLVQTQVAAKDPFAGLSAQEAGEAIDGFHALTEAGNGWFVVLDESHKRSNKMVEDRNNEVTAAKAELAALERVKGQVRDYAGQKQKLLEIIYGTTAATKAATAAYWEQVAALREADKAAQAFLMRQREMNENWSVTGGALQTSRIRGDTKSGEMLMPFAPGVGDGSTGKITNDEVLRMYGLDIEGQLNGKDPFKEITEDAKARAQEVKEAWAQGLGQIGGSFLKTAMEGKQSFSEMTASMLRDIAMLTLKMAAMRAIAGGGSGAVGGQLLSGLLGGFAHGGSFGVPSGPGGLVLPRAEHGADWRVGGTGPTDSKIAMFRVTPGETVHVRTQAQQQQAANNNTVAPIINVLPAPSDPTEVTVAMGGNEGAKVIARHERRYMKRRRLG